MHLLTLLLLCVRGGVEAVRQSVQCYDGYDQQGSEVRATEYMPSLAYHSFDNRIKSCCFTGIFSFGLLDVVLWILAATFRYMYIIQILRFWIQK